MTQFAFKPETTTTETWDTQHEELYKEITHTFPDAKPTTQGIVFETTWEHTRIWEYRNHLMNTLGFFINVFNYEQTW